MESRASVSSTYDALTSLSDEIRCFIEHQVPLATARAPIIDHHHPLDYTQRHIVGLSKFQSHVETEKAFVRGLLDRKGPPKDLTTNAPNLLTVWEEVQRAAWPIAAVAQTLDCGSAGQVKVDVVCRGGSEWIKVNTIKVNRLLAEFREQDSYLNSDYESDSPLSSPGAGPSKHLAQRRPPLQNSLIRLATSLVHAAEAHPRPDGRPPPRVTLVLNRLEEMPDDEDYPDERVPLTFAAIRATGVHLLVGSQPGRTPPHRPTTRRRLVPTSKILLDLSVIIALVCDSTHRPLPCTEEELENRFRALKVRDDGAGLEREEHVNVTKDLRDQLKWEGEWPLVEELQRRLADVVADGQGVEWWVTEEVKGRVPAILDVIGGEDEKARGRALFGEAKVSVDEGEGGFWNGSRYEGKAGVMGDIRVRILENGDEADDNTDRSSFDTALIALIDKMLATHSDPSLLLHPSPAATSQRMPPRSRKSKHPLRADNTQFLISRLPSEHTLRTLRAGVARGWTVLTNNRGAVGKLVRELGVGEGMLAHDVGDVESGRRGEEEGTERARVWVVNPSSLAEWRRKEVERTDQEVLARWAAMTSAGDRSS